MAKGRKAHGERQASGEVSPREPSFPIVGIGASAGGIAALQALLEETPAGTGAAFVAVVHLEATSVSELAEILARKAGMPVEQVSGKLRLKPGHVYVIPPNRQLSIAGHDITALPFDEPRGRRSPIDQFFRSMAGQHEDGYAIILTGAGSDGTMGAKAIKEAGGLILVQDPQEAEYPSMPGSAIAAGLADVILPVRELGRQLAELIKNKPQVRTGGPEASDDELIFRVLTYLHSRTGHDFRRYRRATILRRLTRRMQVTKHESVSRYYDYVSRTPEEVKNLFRELLISVTTFFRDPAAYETLTRLAIARLYDVEAPGTPFRVWVPGCATGEEAYSIAILFAEEAARRERAAELQLFASDLDPVALRIGHDGRYPLAIETDVNPDRLRKFFTRDGDHYHIGRHIRDTVLFAEHSLLRDPPFSSVHLVSCRNLLIYLERDLQAQLLSTLNYALKPGGYLFLGSSEIADNPEGLFQILDREARLYQSKEPTGEHKGLPILTLPPHSGEISFCSYFEVTQSPPVMHSIALELAAPPSILVDKNRRIVNMSEEAGRFIQPSGGQIRNEAAELVRPELRFDLSTGLNLAFQHNQPSLSLGIPVRFNGTHRSVFIQVKPVPARGGNREQAVVFFIEGDTLPEAAAGKPDRDQTSEAIIGRLREDLELTRSMLTASREDYEGAFQDLRAANEELQSINEEYRSTAEELETSKEELQSINEELQTVNAELKIKLDTMARANNDLQNLMAAADVGMLFLDSGLLIKRFTPRITELFNVMPADEGRPISDFTNQLDYPGFGQDAADVLAKLHAVEREITGNGRTYIARIRPYRTLDNQIEGVVCTFVDVTVRVEAEAALKASEARLRLLLSELSHRVKNTLAVVQSMARRSLSADVTSEENLEIFSNRLHALAEAHSLLISSDWRGADLRKLATRQLRPYAELDALRVVLSGPDIMVPPEMATPLALILHELATNATKYGSLSTPTGTLRLEWGFTAQGNSNAFQFNWKESGGPTVIPPRREGFGTWLIQHGMPEGEVELSYHKTGVSCTLTLPGKSVANEGP
jgi:two-component system, chemotaxis family, CheB/CheR fusion protein